MNPVFFITNVNNSHSKEIDAWLKVAIPHFLHKGVYTFVTQDDTTELSGLVRYHMSLFDEDRLVGRPYMEVILAHPKLFVHQCSLSIIVRTDKRGYATQERDIQYLLDSSLPYVVFDPSTGGKAKWFNGAA